MAVELLELLRDGEVKHQGEHCIQRRVGDRPKVNVGQFDVLRQISAISDEFVKLAGLRLG